MTDRTTGNAYITGLYLDIESLNNNLSAYKNLLVEIAPNDTGVNLGEIQKEQLKKVLSDIRFLLTRSSIRVSALKRIKSFQDFWKNNKERNTLLISKVSPDFEQLFEYVVELNDAFINGVSPEFFNSIGEIYSDYNISAQNNPENGGTFDGEQNQL